jgi:hypothetical protein
MKTTILSSVLLLAAASLGCGAPPSRGASQEAKITRRLVSTTGVDGRTSATSLFDSSGRVEARIWECANTTPSDNNIVPCAVDAGYVLVGGGAWANGTGYGALLTASYPSDPAFLTTWEGRSKAQGVSDPHILKVYAIGLRLTGLTRAQLLSNVFVNRHTVGPASMPGSVALTFPCTDVCFDTILPTSYGSFVHWTGAGNLLTTSAAIGAYGKDHNWSDPATITHYSIGIRANIDGFGRLEMKVVEKDSPTVSIGKTSAEALLPAGFVPTGVGALGHYTGFGRLLTRMAPNPADFTRFLAENKDQIVQSSGSVTAQLIALRKAP